MTTTTEEEPSDRVTGEDDPELQERTNTPSTDVPSEKNLEEAAHAPGKKKKRRKRKMKKGGAGSVDVPSATDETADVGEREEPDLTDAPTPAKKKKRTLEAHEDPVSIAKPERKKKTKKKKPSTAESTADSESDAAAPPGGRPEGSTAPTQQPKKKKKKIPVVFEFEADELESSTDQTAKAVRTPSVTPHQRPSSQL